MTIEGVETLTLSHLLVASDEFPGLAKAGVYLDKLTYHRVSAALGLDVAAKPDVKPIKDPIDGIWRAEDGTTLSLQVIPESQGRFGFVQGNCSGRFGTAQVSGLTDINASSGGLGSQATALALLSSPESAAVAFGGLLDLKNGKLDLEVLVNRGTDPKATYVQTEIVAMRFVKS